MVMTDCTGGPSREELLARARARVDATMEAENHGVGAPAATTAAQLFVKRLQRGEWPGRCRAAPTALCT